MLWLLCPQGGVSDTHCIGGWVGPRADLDLMVKRNILTKKSKNYNEAPLSVSYSPTLLHVL